MRKILFVTTPVVIALCLAAISAAAVDTGVIGGKRGPLMRSTHWETAPRAR